MFCDFECFVYLRYCLLHSRRTKVKMSYISLSSTKKSGIFTIKMMSNANYSRIKKKYANDLYIGCECVCVCLCACFRYFKCIPKQVNHHNTAEHCTKKSKIENKMRKNCASKHQRIKMCSYLMSQYVFMKGQRSLAISYTFLWDSSEMKTMWQ